MISLDRFERLNLYREEYDIFTDIDKIKKEKSLVKSVLNLQDKYGKNVIFKAIDLEEKATLRDRNNMIGGHNSGEDEDV